MYPGRSVITRLVTGRVEVSYRYNWTFCGSSENIVPLKFEAVASIKQYKKPVLSFLELAKAETQVKSLNAENMDGITLGRISKPDAQHENQVFLMFCVFFEDCGIHFVC